MERAFGYNNTGIFKITCETKLGTYIIEYNNGEIETRDARATNRKQAKEILKACGVDPKSKIDPNILLIYLEDNTFVDTDDIKNMELDSDDKRYIERYVNDPNRDFYVIYSDKLDNKKGKLIIDGEIQDTDEGLKNIKRREKRYLKKIAREQGKIEMATSLIDDRNILTKMLDRIVYGKDLYLSEYNENREYVNEFFRDREIRAIENNTNQNIQGSKIDKWSYDYNYEGEMKLMKEIRDYKNKQEKSESAKNVLSSQFRDSYKLEPEYQKRIDDYMKNNPEDPFLRTKQMLDDKVKQAKADEQEER